jgi:type IV pilus assembly protein PilE
LIIRKQRGVTLIELMTVLVIVAILAAVAIPSYRQQMLRTNRTNAKTALTQTAQTMERCFTRTNTYVGCVALPFTTPEGNYQIQQDGANPVTATTFSLQAVPQGTQANDTQCATFTLNQANARAVTGSLSATPNQCWSR